MPPFIPAWASGGKFSMATKFFPFSNRYEA